MVSQVGSDALAFSYKFRAESASTDTPKCAFSFTDAVRYTIEVTSKPVGENGTLAPHLDLSLGTILESGSELECETSEISCDVKKAIQREFVSKFITFESG